MTRYYTEIPHRFALTDFVAPLFCHTCVAVARKKAKIQFNKLQADIPTRRCINRLVRSNGLQSQQLLTGSLFAFEKLPPNECATNYFYVKQWIHSQAGGDVLLIKKHRRCLFASLKSLAKNGYYGK